PRLTKLQVNRLSAKVAVTTVGAWSEPLTVTVQLLPLAESQPLQEPTADVAMGVAVSVAVGLAAPRASCTVHVAPQLTAPGSIVTVPSAANSPLFERFPLRTTVSVT